MPYIFSAKKVQRIQQVQLAHQVLHLCQSLLEAFKTESLLSKEGGSSFDDRMAFVNCAGLDKRGKNSQLHLSK